MHNRVAMEKRYVVVVQMNSLPAISRLPTNEIASEKEVWIEHRHERCNGPSSALAVHGGCPEDDCSVVVYERVAQWT